MNVSSSGTLTLELSRLAEGPLRRSVRLRPEAHPWAEIGFSFSEPPLASFTARATAGGGVHIQGELEAWVRLTCRRCLAEGDRRFLIPLDLLLEPGLEPGGEDEGVFALRPEGETVDLAPIMREELVLAVPEFSVCRDECRGLCPHCGAPPISDRSPRRRTRTGAR